jgi:hypothetical protein
MRRILALLLALTFASPAIAADNYAATAGSGLTFAAKSIGGVLYPWWIPANSSGTELFTSGNAAYVQFPSAQAVTGADGWDVTQGTKTDVPCTLPASATACSMIAIAKAAANGINGPVPTQAPTVSIGGVGIIDSAGTNVATVKAASTSAAATDKSLVVQINPQQTPPVEISDGTNVASVKAASTSAAATDKSVVVQINPQQTPPIEISDGTNVASVKAASTSAAATDKSLVVQINPQQTPPVILSSDYPSGATPLTAANTGTTGATTATLTPVGTTTMYICWLSIRANATAAATGNATVTGTITGTLDFTQWTAPLASGLGIVEEIFRPCVPGSSTTQAIAVVSAAPGSGGTVSVSAGGYYK